MAFSDEEILRKIFLATVKSAAGADDRWTFWLDDTPVTSVADFRRETRFNPELLVEFVGETVVCVEMDFNRRKVLIQAGERWENYELDLASAAVLQALVTVEQSRLR